MNHPQAAFAEAVSALTGLLTKAAVEAWDSDRCEADAEAFWRGALRRGWRYEPRGSEVSAETVLGEGRQRLARGEVPDDERRREIIAQVRAELAEAKSAHEPQQDPQ